MGKFIDLTGQKFFRLSVTDRAGTDNAGNVTWACVCECGRNVIVASSSLRNGRTRSCGCLQKERVAKLLETHGQAKGKQTRLYKIYHGIKNRCLKESSPSFAKYGARGITICTEWENSFDEFYKWAMENGYADNLTIDRIDGTRGYSPGNCRWASFEIQNNNTSRNHFITYNGRTQTLAQWAKEIGMNYDKLRARIVRSKWSIERALTTP